MYRAGSGRAGGGVGWCLPDALTLSLLLAGAAAGGFVNGLAGFGAALFALGFWLLVLPPVEAVALAASLSVLSRLQGVWVVRHGIAYRRLAFRRAGGARLAVGRRVAPAPGRGPAAAPDRRAAAWLTWFLGQALPRWRRAAVGRQRRGVPGWAARRHGRPVGRTADAVVQLARLEQIELRDVLQPFK